MLSTVTSPQPSVAVGSVKGTVVSVVPWKAMYTILPGQLLTTGGTLSEKQQQKEKDMILLLKARICCSKKYE